MQIVYTMLRYLVKLLNSVGKSVIYNFIVLKFS